MPAYHRLRRLANQGIPSLPAWRRSAADAWKQALSWPRNVMLDRLPVPNLVPKTWVLLLKHADRLDYLAFIPQIA